MSDKTFRFAPIGDAPDKVVLLSFDDGPKEEAMLTQMLDALDKHGAKAIFSSTAIGSRSIPSC